MCESVQGAGAEEVGPAPSDVGRFKGCTSAAAGEGQQRAGGAVEVPARGQRWTQSARLSRRLLPAVGLPQRAAPHGSEGCWEGGPTEARRVLQQLLLLCAGSTPARVLFSVLGAF